MTCNDCIHQKLCADYVSALAEVQKADTEYISQWLDEIEGRKEQEDNECEHFADRARFVELPETLHLCDTVYFVLSDLDEIDLKEYKFTVGNSAVSDTVQFVTEIGTSGFWVGESPREFAPDYDDFYHLSLIHI